MNDSDFVNNGQTQIKDSGSHENDARGYKQGWSNGLTKREYFAVQILQSFCGADRSAKIAVDNKTSPKDFRVQLSIEYADALIKELSK